MNSSSNLRFCRKLRVGVFITALNLLAVQANALDVISLYTASCVAETGVIVDVNNQDVKLITLDGKTRQIPRYEVIYYASYALEALPFKKVNAAEAPPYFVIKTRQNGNLQDLVAGWPVDFTESRIGFLTISGGNAVIDRANIWEIETHSDSERADISGDPQGGAPAGERIELAPPYPFAHCSSIVANSNSPATRKLVIPPQILLSDPVAIKTELDRLMHGHEQMAYYVRRQRYYAVPFVYGDTSSLGLWTTIGARNAQSQNRSANFTPLLIDERSHGPFSYQQRTVTGVGPLAQGVHEEPQSQAYYALKSSYIQFSGMLDPALLLLGNRYQWTKADFNAIAEDRATESSAFSLGFGLGHYVLSVYTQSIEVGLRGGDLFDRSSMALMMLGLSAQWPSLVLEVVGGSGASGSISTSIIRANVDWLPHERAHYAFSILQRLVQDSYDPGSQTAFAYHGVTRTIAAYANYRFARRFEGGAFFSLESTNSDYGVTATINSTSAINPKGGINIAIDF